MSQMVVYEDDFERILREQVAKTGFSEEDIRKMMLGILNKNGFVLQKTSLAQQIAHARMIAGENAVIENLRKKGL